MKISNLTYTEHITEANRLEGGINNAFLLDATVYTQNVEALGITQGSVSTAAGSASGQQLAALDSEVFTLGINVAAIQF